jgi:predicted GIY-YIG superfamily endonuclease
MAKVTENITKIYIYALHCPKSDEIRYIGKSKNPEKRLKEHIGGKKKYPVSLWSISLLKQGLCPKMTIISEVDEKDWESEEIKQIQLHKDMGCNLLNIALGGSQVPCTNEQRSKNGQKTKESFYSDDKKKRIWAIKRNAGSMVKYMIKKGDKDRANRLIDIMKYAAYKKPHLFGKWASLEFVS